MLRRTTPKTAIKILKICKPTHTNAKSRDTQSVKPSSKKKTNGNFRQSAPTATGVVPAPAPAPLTLQIKHLSLLERVRQSSAIISGLLAPVNTSVLLRNQQGTEAKLSSDTTLIPSASDDAATLLEVEEVIPSCIINPLRGIIGDYYDFSSTVINADIAVETNQQLIPYNQFTCFGHSFFILKALARADQYLLWGKHKELRDLLATIQDPSMMTISISGEDHRGPNVIPKGTLLERAIYIYDSHFVDENGETVIGMLERIGRERNGDQVVKKQKQKALRVLAEEEKKHEATEKDDIDILNKTWKIVVSANPRTLNTNPVVLAALAQLEEQLKKPGNKKVFLQASSDHYTSFDALHHWISHFLGSRIKGLCLKYRSSVPELQFYRHKHKRENIESLLGVRAKNDEKNNDESFQTNILGLDCHFAIDDADIDLDSKDVLSTIYFALGYYQDPDFPGSGYWDLVFQLQRSKIESLCNTTPINSKKAGQNGALVEEINQEAPSLGLHF